MNDNQKAMLLSITLAAMDSIRSVCQPGDARYSRLTRSINKLLVMIDIYRLKA